MEYVQTHMGTFKTKIENPLLRYLVMAAISLGLLLSSLSANAAFLRLSPELEAQPAENNPGTIQILGTLENQGDERALEVRIEEAHSGKILADLSDFGPGEKKDVVASFSEEELGLKGDGSFVLPLRILYKDTNKFGFSAAFVLSYFRKSSSGVLGRSSPVTVGLEEVNRERQAVDVGVTGNFKLVLLNTSLDTVTGKIQFVSSKELELKAKQSDFSIGPQSELRIEIDAKNLGGLVGSSYATYAIVNGQIGGMAFADYNAFLINIVANTPTSWAAAAMIFLALVFAVVGFIFWRRESSSREGMVTISGAGRVIEPEPLDSESNHKD